MGIGKWIGGFLGFMLYGPLGALAGYALGSLFDGTSVKYIGGSTDGGSYSDYTGGGSYYGPYSGTGSSYRTGQRNSFFFSMLVMASYVIKADGKVMHSEMEYVRAFLYANFGTEARTQGEDILKKLFEMQKQMDAKNPNAFKNTINECGAQISTNMSYSQRLQLMDFLINIAKADGKVTKEEEEALQYVATAMQVSYKDYQSEYHMGGTSLEEAYKVLGIDSSATDEEVKKAYREMALKHHPDKVEALGEDVKKAAEKKFQEINAAKEIIYKARGIK